MKKLILLSLLISLTSGTFVLSAKARVTPIYPVDSNLTTLPAGYTPSPLDSPNCAETAAKYYYYRYQISVLFKQINFSNLDDTAKKIEILRQILQKIEELYYCDIKMDLEADEFVKKMREKLKIIDFWLTEMKLNAEARKDIQDLNKL